MVAGVGVPDVVQQVQGHRSRGRVDGQGEVVRSIGAAGDEVARLAQLDFIALAIARQRIDRVQAAAHAGATTGVQLQAIHGAARTVGAIGAGELRLHGGRGQGHAGNAVALHAAQACQTLIHLDAAQGRRLGIEGGYRLIVDDGHVQQV